MTVQVIRPKDEKQWKEMERLYQQAFPANERKPWDLIRRKTEEGVMEALWLGYEKAENESSFAGLAVFMLYGDLALLDYFAVLPSLRSLGLGSRSLKQLRERYRDRRLFLEVEIQDDQADNALERKRRKDFYLRNGMKELWVFVSAFGVDMELLGFEEGITFSQYMDLQLGVNDASRQESLRKNMVDKTPDTKLLAAQLLALTEGVTDEISNLSNASALLYQGLPDLNWAGFYLYKDGSLKLGPFQGRPACVEILLGKGVCGTAAQKGETVVVPDVHQFSGHIACDSHSRSEIVIPLFLFGKLYGVLDLDSPSLSRFGKTDRICLETFARALEQVLEAIVRKN